MNNNMLTQMLNECEFDKISNDLEERMNGIPLGSSVYQNIKLIPNREITPARKQRILILQLKKKIDLLKEVMFSFLKQEVEIKKKKLNIDKLSIEIKGRDGCYISTEMSKLDLELLNIELDEMEYKKKNAEKYVLDTLIEVKAIYNELSKYKKISREEFESEEEEYFELKLKSSLYGIKEDSKTLMQLGFEHTRPTVSEVHSVLSRINDYVDIYDKEVLEDGKEL